ncbi:hypothetical protein Q0Z83_020920 [Actinoplanes sichuanensis]|nr:hypothetical protein Q0Z83_020920 [Actinoplanes sichuanensis]
MPALSTAAHFFSPATRPWRVMRGVPSAKRGMVRTVALDYSRQATYRMMATRSAAEKEKWRRAIDVSNGIAGV